MDIKICRYDCLIAVLDTSCDRVRGWTNWKKLSAIWSSARTPSARAALRSSSIAGSYRLCAIATRRPAASSRTATLWVGAATATPLRRQKLHQAQCCHCDTQPVERGLVPDNPAAQDFVA